MKRACLVATWMGLVVAGCLGSTDDANVSTVSSQLKPAPTCTIDKVKYAAGAQNPGDPCQTCEPSVNKRDWTVLDESCYLRCSDSRDCGGQACIDGECTLDCTSDSQCSPPLVCVLGGGGCQLAPQCTSARDCGGNLACVNGTCTTDCTSDSQCVPPAHCVVGGGGCQL